MRFFLCLICLIFYLPFIPSCARPVRFEEPQRIRENFYDVLQDQAKRPEGIKAVGNIGLKINEEKKPKVKGLIYWQRSEQGLKLRITGMHVLGGTIFDLLAIDGSTYLFISGHNELYYAERSDRISKDKRIVELEKDALYILAPWSASTALDFAGFSCEKEVFSDNKACFSFRSGEDMGEIAFDPSTLAPVYLKLSELSVRYDEAVSLEDGSPYPTKLHFSLHGYLFEMEINLKEVFILKDNDLKNAFDPGIFVGRPTIPMAVLFENLQGKRD
jgi:hypothetical protein